MNRPSPAEKRAIELLEQLQVTEPPVPVEDLARRLGTRLTYESFDGDVSGMLYRDNDHSVIGVNSTHPPTRQRFTVAHEIGHFVMHKGKPIFVDRFARVNWRNGQSDREEVDANAFAAELLMPRRLVIQEIDRTLDRLGNITPDLLVKELAKRFHVSSEAMTYRLANLGVVDPGSLTG
jgi:Zn-dependent peptidase ImmA (M78 family)